MSKKICTENYLNPNYISNLLNCIPQLIFVSMAQTKKKLMSTIACFCLCLL